MYFLVFKCTSWKNKSYFMLVIEAEIDFIIIRKVIRKRKYFTAHAWIKNLNERRCSTFFLGKTLFKLRIGISMRIDKKIHLVRGIGWIKPTLTLRSI